MSDVIARKYANALIQSHNKEELKSLCGFLNTIQAVFEIEKFRLIVESLDVKKEEKIELVLSFLDNKSEKVINFIRLLGENDRLLLLPTIAGFVEKQILEFDSVYNGIVISNLDMNNEDIKKLEESFSKKFGGKVELEYKKTDYKGLKIELDSLGFEVSFSLERLKAQMIGHILKAI